MKERQVIVIEGVSRPIKLIPEEENPKLVTARENHNRIIAQQTDKTTSIETPNGFSMKRLLKKPVVAVINIAESVLS